MKRRTVTLKKTNYLLYFTIPTIVSLLIILLFKFGCSDNFEHRFRRAVSTAAADFVIDEKEYEQLMAKVEKRGEQEYIDIVADFDKLKEYAAKTVNTSPESITIQSTPVAELEGIYFYIETSASMRGYMYGGTRFQDVINDMIGRIDATYRRIPLITRTVTEGVVTYHSSSEYAEDLQTGNFPWGAHTPLHDIFRELLDSTKTGNVTLFITDGIMSGTNQQIRENSQYNKENRTLFKNNIRRAFAGHRDELGVVVYAFTSDYNSTTNPRRAYFDFMNRTYFRYFTDRPFYVFVFGHRDILPDFENNVLLKTAEFDYLESLYVGLHRPAHSYTRFISHLGRQQQRPNCIIRPNAIEAARRFGPENPMQFAIGLDLSAFPDYVKDNTFLNNNIIIQDNPDIVVSSVRVRSFDNDTRDLLNPAERQRNTRTTHYIELTIDQLYARSAILDLAIKMPPSDWYREWSTDCDENIQADDNQTFNFEYLMDGIIEAFDSPFVAKISIPLQN